MNCILEEHKNKHILYFFFFISVAVSLISPVWLSRPNFGQVCQVCLDYGGAAHRNHLATSSPEIPLNHWLLFVVSWLSKKWSNWSPISYVHHVLDRLKSDKTMAKSIFSLGFFSYQTRTHIYWYSENKSIHFKQSNLHMYYLGL